MRRFLIAVSATVALLASGSAFANDDITVDQIAEMTQAELDDLYLEAKRGVIPNGVSQGTAMFFPDSFIDPYVQSLAYYMWQGKVFDVENGLLINRVAGVRAVVAELYYGESLLDGEESVIIDYSNTSILFGNIRDEIRQVSPTIYLGRAYAYIPLLGYYMAVNFVLEFDEPQFDPEA